MDARGWIVFLGATSAMGEHAARIHATRGERIVLVGRSGERLEQIAADLRIRGAAAVEVAVEDLANPADPGGRFDRWLPAAQPLGRVYLFYGSLGDADAAMSDLAAAEAVMTTNYLSAALWSLAAARRLEAQGYGALVAISSVAGDRGRASNFVYGSAKAGLTTLVQGLDHRLSKRGARAVAVRFGFVISPMTHGMKRTGPLWTTAEKAGQLAVDAGDRRRGAVYAPFFWRFIMLAIRLTPTAIFNRTSL